MKRINLLAIVALAAVGATANAQSLVFDGITGATFTSTASTPHNLMGMSYNLGNATQGQVSITGLDFAYVSTAAATYTNVQFDFSFFDVASNATSGTTAAFSTLLGTRTLALGATSVAATTRYTYGVSGTAPAITFNTPLNFNNVSNIGVQILVRADSGAGLVNDQNLTLAVRYGATPTVGSVSSINGYYRNASQTAPVDATTSLLGSDVRTLGVTNQGLALRLYTASAPVPEPATMAALGLGVAALLRRRRKSA